MFQDSTRDILAAKVERNSSWYCKFSYCFASNLCDLRNLRKNDPPQPVVASQKALCAYELFTLVSSIVVAENRHILPASCFVNNVTMWSIVKQTIPLGNEKMAEIGEPCLFNGCARKSLFEILMTKSIVFCDVSTFQAVTNLYRFLIDITYVKNVTDFVHLLKGNFSFVSKAIDDSFNSYCDINTKHNVKCREKFVFA